MKLSSNMMFFVVLLFAIMLFYNTGTTDPTSGDLNAFGANEGTNETSPYIWQLITNPDEWRSSLFLTYLLTIFVATLTLTGILAGLFRMQASDATLFTPVFGILVGFGGISIGTFFSFIRNEGSKYFCDVCTSAPCTPCLLPTILAILIAGGLAIEYIMSCVQWWRTGFVSG